MALYPKSYIRNDNDDHAIFLDKKIAKVLHSKLRRIWKMFYHFDNFVCSKN